MASTLWYSIVENRKYKNKQLDDDYLLFLLAIYYVLNCLKHLKYDN